MSIITQSYRIILAVLMLVLVASLSYAKDRMSVEIKHRSETGLGHSALFDHTTKPAWSGQTSRTNNRSLEGLLTLPVDHNISLLIGYRASNTALVLPVTPAFYGFQDRRSTRELTIGVRVYLQR